MGISRIERFKDYRNSLIKEETPVLETPKSSPASEEENNKVATSTLPMDQVIKTLQNDESEAVFLKRVRRNKIIFIAIIALLSVLLIAGIVIFGILVWR